MLDLEKVNSHLESKTALERMAFGISEFEQGAVLLSSMQKTSSVLMHMFHELGVDNEIVFVDTGFHFHETLQLRDEFMRKYKLNIRTLYPTLTPEQQEEQYRCKLYQTVEGQPVCCDIRKGQPFLRYMKKEGRQLVFGGRRREEGSARANIAIVSEDPRFKGYNLNPIVDWTRDMVTDYIKTHDVPVHSLHSLCYPSIGCQCCTTPVMEGEEARAGRWRHLREDGRTGPAYCGINFTDGSGI
ncbi:MAG: phosphoadenylyl-sulfate reductase [Deltaproteobacteria bacterium]|nr:phosphoadenylyl-sulfate reductase [Deltaproteobacteria bacterium]